MTAITAVAAVNDPLGVAVRSLFSDLRHAGEPAEGLRGTARVLRGQAGRKALGTQVCFCLQICAGPRQGSCVLHAGYRAYGCPYTLASCEWLARRLSGAELPQLSAAALTACVGTPAEWAQTLGIPADRLGRLLVIEDALHCAVQADPAVTKAG